MRNPGTKFFHFVSMSLSLLSLWVAPDIVCMQHFSYRLPANIFRKLNVPFPFPRLSSDCFLGSRLKRSLSQLDFTSMLSASWCSSSVKFVLLMLRQFSMPFLRSRAFNIEADISTLSIVYYQALTSCSDEIMIAIQIYPRYDRASKPLDAANFS